MMWTIKPMSKGRVITTGIAETPTNPGKNAGSE
jgi:hypothetical protein